MASTAVPPKLDMSDPNVRRVVYNMYRGMLGTYNDKANDIVDAMPREAVTEDAGIYAQLQSIINSTQEGRSGPPPPPPPPGMPGSLPSRRLPTEVPERGVEPPAAIQNAMMTKDKKPFTYTPGGLDLSAIKSPRMARRVSRNAQAQELHGEHAPTHQLAPSGPLPPAAMAAMQTNMPTQVFPTGPPPPPPPPSNAQHPPPQYAPPPQAPSQQQLPKIRGFDPQDILSRPTRLQAGVHTGPAPKPAAPEPGLAYGPSASPVQQNTPRSQLGSIYIPPVIPQHQESSPSTASTNSGSVTSPQYIVSTPGTPGLELRKGPTPWVSRESPTPNIERPGPQQTAGGSRIIPIQIEGREPPPQTSPQQYQQQYQSPGNQQNQYQQAVYQQQPNFAQQQQNTYQQRGASSPGGARVIPIQIEGTSSPQQKQYQQPQQQRTFSPHQSSPTTFSPQTEPGVAPPAPQWVPPPQRAKSQDTPDRGSFLPPLGPPQEYGAYNTAGVPLSALRKMQLSDEDKNLMEKLKTQADSYTSKDSDATTTNLYKGAHIPSRVFKILDESVDDEQYLHRETDPRYRGAAIPSRAFRMLQTMTDTAGEVPRGPSRGSASRPSSAMQQATNDGQTNVPPSEQQAQEPRMYTGGSIPSRSFRMLQAMTGQDNPARGRASPNSPSGRETPAGRWCASPAPDPYWGYYPPDPYAYYNYLSDLNAAYGYPPPPPPPQNYLPPQSYPPPFHPQRFANYASDSEENGYSSTDELGQYFQNYRRNMGYPMYMENAPVKPEPQPAKQELQPEPPKVAESDDDASDESVSSSEEEEEETDTDDTEIDEKEHKRMKKGSHKLNKQGTLPAFKSVSDVNIFTSESTATVIEDEWEDCDSKIGDDEQETEEESNSEEVDEETEGEDDEEEQDEEGETTEESDGEEEIILPPPVPEEIIPHQLSVIFEESECGSELGSVRKAASRRSETMSMTSETESTATLDNCIEEEDDESDDDNLMSESSVTVRLPLQLKFSKTSKDEVTTVIVGDSEVKTDLLNVKNEDSSDDEDHFEEAVAAPTTRDDGKNSSSVDDEIEERVVKQSDELEECKSDEADVSFTFSIPTRSNSVITVLSAEDIPKSTVEVIKEEDDQIVLTEVTVNVCLPKKAKSDIEEHGNLETDEAKVEESEEIDFWSSINDGIDTEVETEKTEEDTNETPEDQNKESDITNMGETYEKNVNRLEDIISSILETAEDTISPRQHSKKLSKKDSKDSVEESEEDDSGVTDMSNKIPTNSETDGDTESEYTELNKMSQCQRASTHSRLFQLLQDECEKDDIDDEGEEDSRSEPITSPAPFEQESITARKEKLTLPLTSSEVESQSSSSGVTSPSSPTVTDRLVKELIQSLLHKKKGKKFRKLPMAKLHAAALRILQEDMDPYDTSSASASGDDGFMMSPVRKTHSQPHAEVNHPQPQVYEPLPDSVYGDNYYEYVDYYNSWGHPAGYYPPPEYDAMPSRAFQYLNHPGGYSPGFKPKCPRIPPPPPGYMMAPMRVPTPTSPYYRHYEDLPEAPLSFSDKRERVAKVFDKSMK